MKLKLSKKEFEDFNKNIQITYGKSQLSLGYDKKVREGKLIIEISIDTKDVPVAKQCPCGVDYIYPTYYWSYYGGKKVKRECCSDTCEAFAELVANECRVKLIKSMQK